MLRHIIQITTLATRHVLLAAFCVLLAAPLAHAITMSNTNWILRGGNFNQVSGQDLSSSLYSLGFTSGELGVGLYTGTNYKVKAGFQYLRPFAFAFTISGTEVNFGTVTPGEPILRTSTITVSNRSAYGYQVTAFEKHQLRVYSTGSMIPDTTCDTGTCTETTSAAWSSLLTYGFGYRCDNVSGTDCASGFAVPTSYKQFADLEKSETAQAVMSGATGTGLSSQITYKLNISGTQAAGKYYTVINYIFTPTF